MMLIGETAPYRVASLVLQGISEQLDATSAGVPARVCVVDGAISWDGCGEDDCGQLALAMSRIYLADDFPSEAIKTQSNSPAAMLCVDYVAQVIRCAPTMDENGAPPSCEALDRSAQLVLTDAWSLLVGTSCTLAGLIPASIIDYMLRPLLSAGPAGGCVGSEMSFTVGLERA